MKRWFLFFTLVVAAMAFAGCGRTGIDFDESLRARIVPGTTTQAEVKELFGPPYRKGLQNGHPIWVYEFNYYHSMGPDTSKDIMITFDDNGVVQSQQFMTN